MNDLQQEIYRRKAQSSVQDYLHVRDEKGEAYSFWDGLDAHTRSSDTRKNLPKFDQ